jgi:branched-chain amino acid transport system substrate-binding protein
MTKLRRWLVFSFALSLALSIWAGPALAQNKEPIKWGLLDTMSGPFGVFGKGNVGGVKMAIKEINDSGGILGRRVELIIEDDEANTEVAARKAKKLILQDKVDIIHGAASTSCSAMIMKVAEQYKTLHIDSEFDSASILPAKNQYSFMICSLNEEIERARMMGIKELLKPEDRKRWMIWYPDYSYGRDMKAIYEKELKKIVPDAEIVGILGHPLGETDYSTYFIKIFEAKPQVFVSVDWAGDATNFIKQAIPYGFFEKVPTFSLNGAAMSTIISMADKLPNMIYLCEQGNPYFDHLAQWRQKYMDYVGELPTEDCSPAYYEAVYIYKAAVEKVKSTKAEEVAKALEGMEFTGPTGKRTIRKDHFADVEYIAVPELVKTDKYPFRVPGKTIKIPYEKVKFTSKELVEMGCKWCEGR